MKRTLLAVLLLLAAVLTVTAQPSFVDWTVLFRPVLNDNYDTVGGEIVLVAPEGTVTRRTLPSDAFFFGAWVTDVKISPNFDRLALAQANTLTGEVFPIAFIDLNTMACCTFASFDNMLEAYELGGFSSNGSYFVASFVGSDSTGTFGGVAIYDVLTGNIMSIVPMSALTDEPGAVWALLGNWGTDGIEFYPNCWQCGGAFAGEWQLWNPDALTSDAMLKPSGRVFDEIFGSRKTVHQEMLLRQYDVRFPGLPDEGMFAPNNTVKYVGPDLTLFYAGAIPVIFQNPSYRDIYLAEWVYNSYYYLVADGQNPVAALVGRDGSQLFIDWNYTRTFLTGTPDGWLELQDASGRTDLVRQRFFNGAITSTVLEEFPPYTTMRVLHAPPLGIGLNPSLPVAAATFGAQFLPTPTPVMLAQPTPFPMSAMPVVTMPPPTVTCPNFLPSRLVVGKLGRVTPGKPNNFRDGPSITAKKIGEIPGSGVFEVVSGPVCDAANRLAWWQVRYAGVTGWTAEGQDNTYWTEPLP